MQDRELAARVRTLTLLECEKALKKKKGRLYEAVLLKLAGTVLPRLNEHSGPDGDTIRVGLSEEDKSKLDMLTSHADATNQGEA